MTTKGAKLTPQILRERAEKGTCRCFVCGWHIWTSAELAQHAGKTSARKLMPTREHIIPRSEGGGWHDNIAISHAWCNSSRTTLDRLIAVLEGPAR